MALAGAIALLSGCTDGYPDDLVYPVRSDPLVTQMPTLEMSKPDRPGQLPLLQFQELLDPLNPLQAIKEEEKKNILDPMRLSPEDRRQLAAVLDRWFGTPASPVVRAADEEQLAIISDLRLDRETLEEGSRVYRQHCLHCHGLTGDGRGPTARWVNPHPRDYRQGIFKFTSVDIDPGERKPRREDLYRVIHQGIDGTSMPAFNLLTEAEKQALVSYVIHLSLRGECEFDVIKTRLTTEEAEPIDEMVAVRLRVFLERWHKSQDPKVLITPGNPYPYTNEEMKASVKRGEAIFKAQKPGEVGCAACHLNFGRQSTYRFDAWGTVLRPTDLTRGIYRGGRRPIDLYWRIYAGINGSGMAPFKTLAQSASKDNPKSDQIWDVVNFLFALPYPAMRQAYDLKID